MSIVLLAGCTFTEPIRMRGVVQQIDRQQPEGGLQKGERIAGAQLELHCPGRRPVVLGETDEYGRFHRRAAREIPLDCRLTARREGYHPRSYDVADVCAREATIDDHCDYAGVTIRLHPTGGER